MAKRRSDGNVNRRGGTPLPRRSPELKASLAALALVLLAVAGSAYLLSRSGSTRPDDLLVGADDTLSVHKAKRESVFGMLDQTVDETIPHGSHVVFWSFDVNAHQFANLVPTHINDLWPTEDSIMGLHPTTFGTHPGVALANMLPRLDSDRKRNRPAIVMLLTDGEDQAPQQTKQALVSIAANPDVKAVWFCGVSDSNGFRSLIDRRWRPILGKRLIISSRDDGAEALTDLSSLLQAKKPGGS